MGADREEHLAARAQQLVGDLRSGRPGADHQHRALRQLSGVEVPGRVELHQSGIFGNDRRDHRALEGAGRGDHERGVDRAGRRLGAEAGPAGRPADGQHVHAAADRRCDLLGVLGEVLGDPVLRGEVVGADVGELEPGEPVVPGRAVGDQGVPPLGAPALGDPVPLEHEVGDAGAAQVLAHGQAGLAAADHQRLDALGRRRHDRSVHRKPVGAAPGGSGLPGRLSSGSSSL